MLLFNELQGFTWIPADKQLTDSHTKQGASSLTLTLIFENFLYKFIICNWWYHLLTILLCYFSGTFSSTLVKKDRGEMLSNVDKLTLIDVPTLQLFVLL